MYANGKAIMFLTVAKWGLWKLEAVLLILARIWD